MNEPVSNQQFEQVPLPESSAESLALPGIKVLFNDAIILTQKRFSVMFLSGFLPTLILLAVTFGAGLISFLLTLVNKNFGIIFGVLCAVGLFAAYIYMIFLITASQLTALRDFKENTGTKENLVRARVVMWSLALVNIIKNLAVLGASILLIVPGIILGIRYSFGPLVMVTEGKKGRSALAQSKAYVMGRTGQVFVRMFLLGLLFYIPFIIIQILGYFINNQIFDITFGIIYGVFQVGFYYFSAAYIFVMFFQLKSTAPQADGTKYIGGVTAWTIWGFVGGVMFIVGVVASVLLISLSEARTKARDAGRILDIQTISASLEEYYQDQEFYPKRLSDLVPDYATSIPEPRLPNDGSCTKEQNNYNYIPTNEDQDYQLTFCLGRNTKEIEAGPHTLGYDSFR
jgi:type II secretory pathway pseudopilin PulG